MWFFFHLLDAHMYGKILIVETVDRLKQTWETEWIDRKS